MVNHRIQKRYTGRLWTRDDQPESRHKSPRRNIHHRKSQALATRRSQSLRRHRHSRPWKRILRYRRNALRLPGIYSQRQKLLLKRRKNHPQNHLQRSLLSTFPRIPTRPQSSEKRISAYQRRQHQHDPPVAQAPTANCL